MIRVQKLKQYIVQVRGVSYKPSDVRPSTASDGVVLLKANNIDKNNSINLNEVIYVNKNVVKESQYLRKGDILICASSGSKDLVGKAAYIENDMEAVFGAFCKVIRPRNINSRYLGYYFDSAKYRKTISLSANGANINNIRTEDIDNLVLNVPSEMEQEKCVAILNSVYRLIASRKKDLEDLDLLIKSRYCKRISGEVAA